jgi:hypothetical protein
LITVLSNDTHQRGVGSKIIELNRVSEIIQNENHFVAHPIKMMGYKNKVYLLDRKFRMVLVFSKNEFSHIIGKPGQGPGEISEGTSFDVFKDKLYLLNKDSRIELFDISGEYKKTIRLKKSVPYALPTDLKIYKGNMYVTFNVGETRVGRYDLEGNFLDDYIRGGDNIGPYKNFLSNPLSIYISTEDNALILFNRFNGDIEVFDLNSRVLRNKTTNYDDMITEKVAQLRKRVRERYYDNGLREIKSILIWRSAFDRRNNQLLIIPSQISVDEKDRRKLFYTFNINNGLVLKRFLRVKGVDIIIRDCCFIDDKPVILDYDLNLFLGG